MTKPKVLIPLPSYGCDPTEVAIPWQAMNEEEINITFITPDGKKANADHVMLTGKTLGLWKGLLMAAMDAREAYYLLEQEEVFLNPLKYSEVEAEDYDAILLPGGHDKRVKEYLESDVLQKLVVDFFNSNKPVAAICHGVVLAARSIDPATKRSVLYNRKTTSLLKTQEMLAYRLTKSKLNDYYLTYPGLTVEDEVKSVLSSPQSFKKGPVPLKRDKVNHLKRGFVVKDGNYISARWPGDIHLFSKSFVSAIHSYMDKKPQVS